MSFGPLPGYNRHQHQHRQQRQQQTVYRFTLSDTPPVASSILSSRTSEADYCSTESGGCGDVLGIAERVGISSGLVLNCLKDMCKETIGLLAVTGTNTCHLLLRVYTASRRDGKLSIDIWHCCSSPSILASIIWQGWYGYISGDLKVYLFMTGIKGWSLLIICHSKLKIFRLPSDLCRCSW